MPELRFRDGTRQLPEAVANLMVGLDTRTMTFDQALAEGNRRQLGEYVGKAQRRMVRDHLARFGKREV